MKNPLFTAVLGLCAPVLAAQQPRDPVLVEDTLVDAVGEPTLASDGDLSAIAYGDGGSLAFPDVIRVSTSDGRGLAWSAPVRVDAGPSGTTRRTTEESVQVLGDHVYVLWLDDRSGTQEAYLNRSLDGGVTWEGEAIVRNGFPGPTGETNAALIGVAEDPAGGADRVFVLMNTQDPTGAYGALFLAVSYDAGAHFGPALHVPDYPVGSGPDVDEMDLCVEGYDAVHILWKDDRIGGGFQDVWYKRFDGTALLGADALMNATAPGSASWGTGIYLDARDNFVVAAWQDVRIGAQDHVRYDVSASAGAVWAADLPVGGYALGADHVGLGDVYVEDGVFAIAYRDDRTGSYEATVAVAAPAPVVLSPDWTEHRFAAGGSVLYPRLKGAGDYLAVSFRNSLGNHLQAAVSRDRGATFLPELDVGFSGGGDDYQEMAFNAAYGNALFAWLHDDAAAGQHLYAGGFRPQTLSASLVAGAAGTKDVALDLSTFAAGESAHPFVVLVAAGAGGLALPLPDGRVLGLDPATLLPIALSLSLCSGVIDGTGAGHVLIPGLPAAAVPAGLFQCVALTFDPAAFGSITDVDTLE
jgi:hypothetical protein